LTSMQNAHVWGTIFHVIGRPLTVQLVRALRLSAFDQTEAMSEWITAEGNRRTTLNLKQLLLSCTSPDCPL